MTVTPVPIQATEAHVTTATVEVRVLRIGAKQMTLAVFRQLPRDDEITGEPWGRVNYHNQDCHRSHEHVIWQAGDELRHAVIAEPDKDPAVFLHGDSWAESLWDLWVLDGWKPHLPYRNRNFLATTEQGVKVHGRLSDQAMWATKEGADMGFLERRVESSEFGPGELRARFVDEVEAELGDHDARTARWRMVVALPQLFVAV